MTSRDKAAISADIDDLYDAFLAADRRRFDAHLDPDVTTWETHLPGPLRTRAELDDYRDRRDSAGARPRLAVLAARDKRIDVWGDTAVARYVLVAKPADPAELTEDPAAAPGGTRHSRVTDVLRRTGDGWLIVHHHSELLSPELLSPDRVSADRA